MKPLNPFAGPEHTIHTTIIPVEFDYLRKTYTIKVHEEMWNHFQIALITGANENNVVVRFDVKDVEGGA